MVLGRIDHRHAQRRRVGELALHVDLGLHAREIPRFEQPPLVEHHLVAVVHLARMHRHQVLDQRIGIALRAAHVQLAEAKRRSARNLHHQRGAVLLRIDVGPAVGDARRSVAPAGELAHRLALRPLPLVLAKRLAAAQEPALAHFRQQRARLAVARRRAAEADLDLVHAGALARLDAQPHHPGLLGRFDLGAHLRREIAVGGRRLARLVHRLVDQPLEPFGIHVGIEAPAHDVQPLLERALQLARRFDLDAIIEPRERGAGDAHEDEQGQAHAG